MLDGVNRAGEQESLNSEEPLSETIVRETWSFRFPTAAEWMGSKHTHCTLNMIQESVTQV